MTARVVTVLLPALTLCAVLLWAGSVAGQTQPISAVEEPPAPEPTAAVQRILVEAARLAEAKQATESLKKADQALDAAREAKDKSGEAFAQEARAKALQDLHVTEEAVVAWQNSVQIWAGTGDVPQEISALVRAGRLYIPANKEEAGRLFAEGLSASKMSNDRPLALIRALHECGLFLAEGNPGRGFGKPVDIDQKRIAWEYLNTALLLEEKHAPESLSLVETLNALAKITFDRARDSGKKSDYAQARDYAARALDIGQRLAPDSPVVVESLKILGRSERFLSVEGADARSHYQTALRMQRKLAPGGSIEEIELLALLGSLESDLTNNLAARQYLKQAVDLGNRLAPESKEFEYGLEVLGVLEVNEGDPLSAREHLQQALAIREKLQASVGPILLYLGAAANDQGDFASARDYFERALNYFQDTNPNAPEIQVTLINLSEVFERQGDLASALTYSQRALAISEQKEGNSPNTARSLGLMGDVLRDQHKFDEAAEYYKKSLGLWEKFVPDSLDVAFSLERLSSLARAQGNLNVASDYDRRALELGQKSCPNSWCVVDIIAELGELAYEMGDLSTSANFLLRALQIRETTLGSLHPLVAGNLNDVALLFAAQGKTNEALVDALKAEEIGAEHLRVSIQTLSERQALDYEAIRASGLNVALTLAGDPASSPAARGQVFDAVIRSRALVFDELAARQRSAYAASDTETKLAADQLFSTRTRLATLVVRGPGDSSPEEYHKLLDAAREQKENAERRLAERSVAFRQDQARARIGLEDVAAYLPTGTALVAFMRYERHDLRRTAEGKPIRQPVPSYAAFVLPSGKHEPEFVCLGTAREIEGLLQSWREAIAQQADVPDGAARETEAVYRRAGAALRRKVWDPLLPSIGKAREVFIVPDASLHLLNLSSLPVGNQYLIESGPVIHYLSTERDLVPVLSRHGEGILVLGNPAFDHSGTVLLASGQPSSPSSQLHRGPRSSCETFRSLRFPPLPESQREAVNITTLWRRSTVQQSSASVMRGSPTPHAKGEALQLTGTDASLEGFIHGALGKRVLHLATHGFFLQDRCESESGPTAKTHDERFLTSENPLLLSGLAFAGANRRASAKPEESDGILTAEEIAGINLDGVDWAVLSACDTGVGEIKVGEGVFGLRRAFQLAGVKTVIMSLWPVEDQTTKEWMETLYREHLLNGKATSASVRTASLHILKERRSKKQSTHPFYWGPFIAAGDWH